MILGMLLWFNLTLGIQYAGMGDLTNYFELPPITAEIEIHAENEWFDIYGIYYNGMKHINGLNFAPVQDSFSVGAAIKLEGVIFQYEHNCLHPVSWRPDVGLVGIWGGHDKFTITINSKD